MNIFIQLFLMFVKLSLFSFGGGYVMIPIMMEELEKNKLLDPSQVADLIALAGMSPGAVAVNAAVALGYEVNSSFGVLSAFLGIAIPCAIVVITAATYFFKIYNSSALKAALYGLRPVITGIIVYAAVKISLKNSIFFSHNLPIIKKGINIFYKDLHLFELKSLIIIVVSFFIMSKTKIHPILVIISGAFVGIMLF